MASVVGRIGQITQPRGGYLNPRQFVVIEGNDGLLLKEENINEGLTGSAVDYLSRVARGDSVGKAFAISMAGALKIGQVEAATALMAQINGLDDRSIISACKLAGYDVCFRSGSQYYRPVEEINPDRDTVENIRIMVGRSTAFFRQYGPVTVDGFTFPGGYTATVSTGDGDFLTADTLWDFKTSKRDINSKYTLQLLMYYLMGMHSTDPHFKTIRRLGIFNPRLNKVYLFELSNLSQDTIAQVERDVIGYR